MAHNTLANKIKAPKSQIITRKNPIPSYSPNKEGNTPRALTFQIPFQVLWSNYFAFVVKVIEVP